MSTITLEEPDTYTFVDADAPASQPEGHSAAGTVYARVARVAAAMQNIRKDGHNKHHGYYYVSKDAIFAALKPALDRAGLAIVPTIEAIQPVSFEGANGRTVQLTRVRLAITVASEETSARFVWYGDGQDTGDKAVSKAVANGMKSWLINTFQIPAGDDDETPASASESSETTSAALEAMKREAEQQIKEAQDHASWLARISDLQSQANEYGINFVVLGQPGVPLAKYTREELKDYGTTLREAIRLAKENQPEEQPEDEAESTSE